MNRVNSIILGLGLALCVAGQAHAGSCTDIYTSSNGGVSFPGTNIGAVGSASGDVCQIGDLSKYNGGSGGAFVNGSHNPSNYEFFWGGGALTITEAIGNNGTGFNIDIALDHWNGTTATAVSGASIQVASNNQPEAVNTLISGMLLNTGDYILSTSLAQGSTLDPNYQANFFAVPEPGSFALLGIGLLGLALTVRRRV